MKIFKIINSKIRYKLIIGFIFISLFGGVVGYIGFSTIRHIENDYELISKSRPLVQSLEDMKFACLRLISSASEYAYIQAESKNKLDVSPLEQEINLINQSCNLCHKAFSQYVHLVQSSFPELTEDKSEIRDYGSKVHIAALEFIEMKEKGIAGTEALEKKEEMEIDEMGFLRAVDSSLNHTNSKLEKERLQLISSISSSLRDIIIFSGLTISLSVLFGFLYSRSLSKPITKLTKQVDDFRKGNLDVRTDIKSSDEIGVLEISFNEMAERIKLLIIQLEDEVKLTREAKELLKRSNKQIKLILEVAGEGIFGLDVDGNFTSVNPVAAAMLGYRIEEILGKHSHTLIHHSYHDGKFYPDEKCAIYETLHDGKSHQGEEYYWKKDGTCFPVVFSSFPIIENEMITGAVITFSDITDRKQTEIESQVMFEIAHGVSTTNNLDELLKLIHQSLSKVIYAENCFVALYDQNTGLFSFPFFEDKFDTTPEPAALRKSCLAYVFRTGKPLLLSQKLFDQLVEQDEVELIGTNSPSWIGVPLKVPFRTIGVLILQHYVEENVYAERDVMFLESVGHQIALVIERKLAEEEITKHNEELLLINAEKDKFFSIIAHDLRSPFQGFLALTEMIADNIAEFSNEEIVKFVGELNKSTQNLYKLLQNLLDWAQLKKGSFSFTPEEFLLKTIVAASIEQINKRAIQKGITIINEVPGEQKVFADERMINSILNNLISNAVKFTSKDGKVIIKAKTISNDMSEISVEDSGIGMTESTINKLFKIDEKVGRKGTDGEPSTGLGLLLCKEFVEKHGGKIWAVSEEGKGSTFIFNLPMR